MTTDNKSFSVRTLAFGVIVAIDIDRQVLLPAFA